MTFEPVGSHVQRWADVQNVGVLSLQQVWQAGLGAAHIQRLTLTLYNDLNSDCQAEKFETYWGEKS